MAGFSAADAAFTGFRVVWERPWAVAIWAAVQFTASLGDALFVAASAGQAIRRMAALGIPQVGDPRVVELVREVAPTYGAVLIAGLVLNAVFYAAMNRAVMRPAESWFGYVRLASDELRQLGLFAVLILLALGFYMVVLIVAATVIGVLGAMLGASAQTGAGVLLVVLQPAVICALIYFGVRLSLASPITFASGRVSVFGSWAMTRGRFWPLFGTYLIAIALGLVVFLLTKAIAVLAVAILGGGGQQALATAIGFNPTSIAEILSPPGAAYLLIVSIGAALSAPITICPPAAIYQSLTGAAAPASVSRAFD